MSKCVVYQSGGFTNDGIGYRKFSLEELEEMKKENVKSRSTGMFVQEFLELEEISRKSEEYETLMGLN